MSSPLEFAPNILDARNDLNIFKKTIVQKTVRSKTHSNKKICFWKAWAVAHGFAKLNEDIVETVYTRPEHVSQLDARAKRTRSVSEPVSKDISLTKRTTGTDIAQDAVRTAPSLAPCWHRRPIFGTECFERYMSKSTRRVCWVRRCEYAPAVSCCG